jgi:hypothetical protein
VNETGAETEILRVTARKSVGSVDDLVDGVSPMKSCVVALDGSGAVGEGDYSQV